MRFNRAIILHGKPGKDKVELPGFDPAKANWLGWLANELRKQDVAVMAPSLHDPSNPNFDRYLRELDKLAYFAGLVPRRGIDDEKVSSKETIIVTQSASSGPAMEWVLMNGFKGGFLSVAGWIDPDGRYPEMREPDLTFLNGRELDADWSRDNVAFLSSSDDNDEALRSHERLTGLLSGSTAIEVDGYEHFVTGKSLPADYELENGLVGSTCPLILDTILNF